MLRNICGKVFVWPASKKIRRGKKPPCLWLLVGLGFNSLENGYSKCNKKENLVG